MVIGRTRLVASSIGHLVDSTAAVEFLANDKLIALTLP
jgi:hypothetical protein